MPVIVFSTQFFQGSMGVENNTRTKPIFSGVSYIVVEELLKPIAQMLFCINKIITTDGGDEKSLAKVFDCKNYVTSM